MSFNVAMLEAMKAEGLDLAACIRILRSVGPDSAAEKRRAWDRERKREQREAERLSGGKSGGNPPDPAPNELDILTPTQEKKSEPKGSSKKPKFALPTDIPAEPWGGFEEMRKRIHKPMTDHARTLAVSELRRLRDEEGWPPGEVLNHCTMNSYQGIYPPHRNNRHDRPPQHPNLGKTTAAIAGLGDWNDDRPM